MAKTTIWLLKLGEGMDLEDRSELE